MSSRAPPWKGGSSRWCWDPRAATHAPDDLTGAVIALNSARSGHVYPTYRYEVCREKVREYAHATGAGVVPDTGDVIAPPTFAACFTFRGSDWAADEELGAHTNLVHGSQAFDFHRPLRVGDTLECTPSISDIANKGRIDILTFQVECLDAQTREPAVTARSTIIFFNTEPAAV